MCDDVGRGGGSCLVGRNFPAPAPSLSSGASRSFVAVALALAELGPVLFCTLADLLRSLGCQLRSGLGEDDGGGGAERRRWLWLAQAALDGCTS